MNICTLSHVYTCLFQEKWMFTFHRVEDAENLLEMPDENVTQLSPLRSSYFLCTCENHDSKVLNETVCSKDKTISCDVFKTKRYQKNTCFASRKRRSLQANLSFIPNNFVQHTNRLKACFITLCLLSSISFKEYINTL